MEAKKRYVYSLDPSTGKLSRRRRSDRAFDYDDSFENDGHDEVVRAAHCPYEIEKPEVLEKLTKPFETVKISCNLDIELALSAAFNEHEHEIVTDIDKSKFPEGTDFSEWEFDPGSWFCGLFFEIRPTITASTPNVEINRDDETLAHLEAATVRAESSSEELQEVFESKRSLERLSNFTEILKRTEEYLKEHLKSELERVAERLAFEIHTLDETGIQRDHDIKLFLGDEETALRSRLPAVKGRVPNKKRGDFGKMRSDFLTRAFELLAELEKSGLKLNKNQLAKKMFRSDNPLLLLNRKLKEFDLNFEQIRDEFIEQKSS